jgi:hypothetical protein
MVQNAKSQAAASHRNGWFASKRCRVSDVAVPKALNLHLWFDEVLVAELRNVFPHQGTWFAEYRPIVVPEQGRLEARLCEFIQFCEEWHERLAREENPDASEFDPFMDVIESAAWRVPCPNGTELRPAGAPVFVRGEASWNHAEGEPSRELAAGQLWARLTGNQWPP